MLLLEPTTVGAADLPNRLVFGPHETNLGRGRAMSEGHVDYYRRRAVGGCGLIVTEEASVHDSDWPYERAPLAEACATGWAAVAEVCRLEGAVCLAAIGHAGLQGSSAYSQRGLWAPSLVADAVTRELPKEIEPEDIEAVLEGFGSAASTAVEAGMAGVEVNAGQHSLVRQFLSGLTNLRGDEWGSDGAGRLRFATEVLTRVRSAIGDSVLGLRLSCDELAPWAGLTPESAADVAVALSEHVDYLVVVRGSIYSVDATRPDANTDGGFNLGLVEQIRAAVDPRVAVAAQGSIIHADQAESILGDGRADLVEMTRAQIADPDLADRLREGRRPRPCLLCNQRCRVRDARNPVVSCVMNPSAGHEAHEPERPTITTSRRSFAVVGAGPAGLELARCLASAGHVVTVLDRSSEPGGAVPSWAHGPGRAPFAAGVRWLAEECERLGVDLRLGQDVGPDEVGSLEAAGAEVLLCTGGRAGRPTYDIDDGVEVLTAAAVLADLGAGEDPPTGPVAVWDPIGGPIAISVALRLAPHCAVTLITPDVITGTQLALTGDLAAAGTRLLQAGVILAKRKVLRSVGTDGIEIEDRFNGERTQIEATQLVDAGHRLADDELWRATGERLARAGDCVAPRTIHEAVLEGRRLAVAQSATAPDRVMSS